MFNKTIDLRQLPITDSRATILDLRHPGKLEPSIHQLRPIACIACCMPATHRSDWKCLIISLSDGNFGKQLANRNWNGMLGMVVKKV